ncbi:MAG: protein translocase subunit SecDF [Bacteroidales bacterium]
MQNKGLIKFFAIAFALVCLYQLSFTYFANRVERNAESYAHSEKSQEKARSLADGDPAMETYYMDSIVQKEKQFYLDSMMNQTAFNLGFHQYTFRDVKERELNLGLDLRGGMNVTLEISVPAIVRALAADDTDQTFETAMEQAIEEHRTSRDDFVTVFGRVLEEVDPGASLAYFFSTPEMRDHITVTSSNEEVLRVLRREVDQAVDRSFQILRTRIDRFGVAQPNIQRLAGTGRILVELPGIKEPDRVRRLLQGTAKLEFWETYEFSEIYEYFWDANDRLADMQAPEDEAETDSIEEGDLIEELADDPDEVDPEDSESIADMLGEDFDDLEEFQDFASDNPLFAYLTPAFVQDQAGNNLPGQGPVVGYAAVQDTARVNRMLDHPQVQNILPRDLRLYWNVKPVRGEENLHELVAIRETTRDGTAPLTGGVITDARQDFTPTGQVQINMSMNNEGARTWRRMTADNIGRSIAIVLDNYVYSFPTVSNEISGGRSQITGQFSVPEAQDLANILRAGSLPAPARIVEEAVVGPSLGEEAINSGFTSFVIAFIVVLFYMGFYYSRAGMVADLALVANVFFIMGVLASLGAVLTLPGIAGIVLTLGMAVDANVIIYERIIEELRAGKGLRLAITDGYNNAYSAIIDGNITTLLTGVVLYIFGTGPVQGFATTLIIGIISSLFTAILLSRLIFTYWLDKNIKFRFNTKLTKDVLTKVNFDFIGVRKRFYVISAIVILLGLGSFAVRGLSYGVDFSGGRSYVVRFEEDVNTDEIRASLVSHLEEPAEVITFGSSNQVRITTGYLIDDNSVEADSIAGRQIYEGIKDFFEGPMTYEEYVADDEDKVIGRLSSQKVGPSVASDIKVGAVISVAIALLIIFTYIASRFRKWQFGLGSISTLFHDSIIVISLYSLLYNVVPWTMEIDQAFIAAILTIIGYSVNDTVVIFDRIRENINLFPRRELKTNINNALNATLSRTFNTSATTIAVLLIIFLFGGEVIRGFAFALMIGVAVGTYSSLFNSAPIAYDLLMMKDKNKHNNKSNKK